MRLTTTVRLSISLLGTVGVLAVPTLTQAAQAASVPKVLNQQKRMLTPAAVTRAKAHSKQTGHFPTPPALATHKGLRRATQSLRGTSKRNGKRVEKPVGKPSLRTGKLFGAGGTYEARRLNLYAWVNYVFQISVPTFGGTFRQPKVYELANVGDDFGCGPINNLAYCWGGPAQNTVAWASPFWRDFYNAYGDGAAGSVLAHEYGHGTMYWMGWTNKGQFQYSLYSEGFADCIAGGWLNWMYFHKYTDASDFNEFTAGFSAVADSFTDTTNYTGHGDRTWRLSAGYYGWNNGFGACIRWGRSIAAGTAG